MCGQPREGPDLFLGCTGQGCLCESAEILNRGPFSLKQGFSEKVLCQRKLQTQLEETWTVRASRASQKGRAESLMSKEERDNMRWLSLTSSSRALSHTQLHGLCPGARSCPPQAQVKPTQIWLRNVHVKRQAW